MVTLNVAEPVITQDSICYTITGSSLDARGGYVELWIWQEAHQWFTLLNTQTNAGGSFMFRSCFTKASEGKEVRWKIGYTNISTDLWDYSNEVSVIVGGGGYVPPPPPDPDPEPSPNGFPVPCLVRAIKIPASGQIWLRKNVRAWLPRWTVKGYYDLSKTLLQVF